MWWFSFTCVCADSTVMIEDVLGMVSIRRKEIWIGPKVCPIGTALDEKEWAQAVSGRSTSGACDRPLIAGGSIAAGYIRRSGAKYILKNSKFDYNTEFSDLYGHYYESQAMMNRGGEDWKTYNKNFRDEVLNNQADDGSFKATGSGKHGTNRVHYRTCLCTLMLEVYYRFLPGTGAGTSR